MALFFYVDEGRPAFFDDTIHGDAVPADAVEITAARHAELLEGQAQGKVISATSRGTPLLMTPKLSVAELRISLVAAVKREAQTRIENVSPLWRQLNDLRDGELDADAQDRFARIDAIRAASDAIEVAIAETSAGELTEFSVSTHSLWPEAN